MSALLHSDFLRTLSVALYRRWKPGRIFVILTTYMDESGTHGGSPATVMAGALANSRQWQVFESHLSRMKRQYGFRVFHATEFRKGDGDFKGWSPEKCQAFLQDFGIASAGLTEVVGTTLPNAYYESHYKRRTEDPRRLRLDTAYALCFRYCLTHLVMEAYRRLGHHKRFAQTVLHVIAESGHRHSGDAKRVFDEMKAELKGLGSGILGGLTFAAKDECDPLMLADYLAYGTFAMESRGAKRRDALPAPPVSVNRKVTGWTTLNCTAEGLAELKASLIDGLKRGGGWKATFLAPSPRMACGFVK